jgi:cell division protein FtsW (lipid II flippase)
MSVTVGLLPITGITLPLVSYGGSSLVATYIMIGLAMNFASRRPARMERPSFEFDSPDPATT